MHKCLKIHSRIIKLSIRNSLYHQHLYKKRFPRSNNSKNCKFFVTSFLQQMNGIIELRSCEICIGDTDRNSWGVTSGYQDSILFFFRAFIRAVDLVRVNRTCLLDGPMLPRLGDWCLPSFHRHDYINQRAPLLARTLFLPLISLIRSLFILRSTR